MVLIPDFTYDRVRVADDVELNVAVGGSGDPVVLLHGFPQTHLMWRHVAAELAHDHTVICPDLRGYGNSSKPPASSPIIYSKRSMADDVVKLASKLGHERFALAGHDRGTLVAFRAGLDHPRSITHLACLDSLPTYDTWDVLHGTSAAVAFHLYLMAQPPGLPEAMITATADRFFGHFLDVWTKDPAAIPGDVRTEYLNASRNAVTSIVADYRASAGIDVSHDLASRQAGEQLRMPVTVLMQDWGAALAYDVTARWKAWAPDLELTTVDCGHFMAEEAPDLVASALRRLFER